MLRVRGQILYYEIGCDRGRLWLDRYGLTMRMRTIT
jgi:hypothetical protein